MEGRTGSVRRTSLALAGDPLTPSSLLAALLWLDPSRASSFTLDLVGVVDPYLLRRESCRLGQREESHGERGEERGGESSSSRRWVEREE